MLERVGAADLDTLFADLPADLRDPAIDLPSALTEPELIALLGGEADAPARRDESGISIGGSIIHEVGTVRMGDDPDASALNGFCQSHDARNLFVCDGASFVSNPDKNPTLTINALAWRASEYLADEMNRGNL